MERLRETISQYSRWNPLCIYIDRIEGHIESDFSLSIENAKSLLETIGKEICNAKSIDLPNTPSINAVLKKAFIALGYSNLNLVNKISGSLASIGQELGNLRNEISPTSHGRLLIELDQRNNKIDTLTREFLIDSTLAVALFLIRAFEAETENFTGTTEETSLNYENMEDFNDFWDGTYGEFEMAAYSYTASEILFNLDYKAYETEYKAFCELAQEEDVEGGDS